MEHGIARDRNAVLDVSIAEAALIYGLSAFADEHLPAGADSLRPKMKDAVNPAAHLLVHVTILSAAAQAAHRF